MLINITKKGDVFLIWRNNDEFSFSANWHSFFIKLIQNIYYLKVLNNNVTKYSLRFKLKEDVFDFIIKVLDEIKFEDAKDKIEEEIFWNISEFELFNWTASTTIIDSELIYNPNKKETLPIWIEDWPSIFKISNIENVNKINNNIYFVKFKWLKFLKIWIVKDGRLSTWSYWIWKGDKIYKVKGWFIIIFANSDSSVVYMTNDWEDMYDWLPYRKWKNECIVKDWGAIVKSTHKNGNINYILYLYNDKKNYFSRLSVKEFIEVSEWNFIIDWFKVTIQEIEKFIDNKKNTELFFIEKWKLIYNDL